MYIHCKNTFFYSHRQTSCIIITQRLRKESPELSSLLGCYAVPLPIKQTLLKPLPIRQCVNPLMKLIPHFKRARVEHVRNAVQPQIIVAISEPVRIFVTIRQDNIKNIEHLLPVQISQMLFKPPPQIVLSPCCPWVDAAR